MKIGWIGVGHMGKPMATHILEAGHELTVHDLQQSAAAELLERGAHWAKTPAEAAADKDIAITCLPVPRDVEAVCLGDAGIIEGAASNTVVVDCSTNSLMTVRDLHATFADAGITFLDSPVSGGVRGAIARDLCVMVGGDESAYNRIKPVFDAMGDKVMYCGPVGNGTICKLAHQLFSAFLAQASAEVLTMGVKAGVPLATLVEAISRSAAGKNPPMDAWKREPVSDDFEADELTFYLELHRKDVRLANEIGRGFNVPMDLGNLVEQRMIEAMNRGWARKKAGVVRLLQEERANVDLSEA